MHAILIYCGNRPSHKQRPPACCKHTDRTNKNTLCTKLSAQCNEKCSEDTQTLCAGCSKAEPKIFAPPQTPFSGAWDGQNLISWRCSLPLPTNPVWWGLMHAILSYHGNRLTHTPTHRQDWLQYTVRQLASAQCNENVIIILNITSMIPLLKGLDTSNEVDLTTTQQQCWPDDLPAATTDSCGYQHGLNPCSLGTSLST